MARRVGLALVAAILVASCGLTARRAANAVSIPYKCADGLPVVLLQSLTCTNGYCGYSCAPGRWDVARCP